MVVDFELPEGDSQLLEFTIYEGDGETLADVTTATITWAARHRRTGIVVTQTEGSGLTKPDPANGRIDVVVAKGSMTPSGLWDHELEVVDGDVSRTPVLGVIAVKRTIRPAT